MKILVNNEEIKEFKNGVMMHINNIANEVNKLEQLKKSFVWEGSAYTSFMNKYDANIQNIKKQMNKAVEYVDFLDEFDSSYRKAQDKIKSEYSKSDYNIGVGSGNIDAKAYSYRYQSKEGINNADVEKYKGISSIKKIKESSDAHSKDVESGRKVVYFDDGGYEVIDIVRHGPISYDRGYIVTKTGEKLWKN